MTQSVPPPMPNKPPPPSEPYGSPPPRKTSAAAVASLVLGILGCVPFVTGLLAVVLGIIGVRKTRQPHVGGRGMAIAGLVLGLVSLAGWGFLGGGLGIGYVRSKPARVVAEQFTKDLSTGNVVSAHTKCTGNIAGALDGIAARVSGWGQLQDMTSSRFNYGVYGGTETCTLDGTATFANTRANYSFRLVKQGGVFKVDGFSLLDQKDVLSGAAPSAPATNPGG